MLDRAKLVQKISQLTHENADRRVESVLYAQKIWDMLCSDQDFLKKYTFWHSLVSDIHPITPFVGPYVGCSVDGSQIYPDRHSGCDYFLINIGGIIIRYGGDFEGAVSFVQEPYIFSLFLDSLVSIEWVNAQRYAYELNTLIGRGLALKNESGSPLLLLLDGSLIFWHLEAGGFKDKNYYVSLYNEYLLTAYRNKLALAAYISKPKSKDLVLLSNLFIAERLKGNSCFDELGNGINDTHLLQQFLPPGHCTTIFFSPKTVQSLYHAESAPCFLYCNVYSEIVRIEFPQWVANSPETVEMMLSLIFDQVQKGGGYPLVVAEAHHHAVVKKNDRDFFYYALECELGNKSWKERSSQKQQKKNNKYF